MCARSFNPLTSPLVTLPFALPCLALPSLCLPGDDGRGEGGGARGDGVEARARRRVPAPCRDAHAVLCTRGHRHAGTLTLCRIIVAWALYIACSFVVAPHTP